MRIILLILSVTLIATYAQQACPVAAKVSHTSYAKFLTKLAGLPGEAIKDKKSKVVAISSGFRKAGLQVTLHSSNATEGTTIIGRFAPENTTAETPVWIVSAHYDTVSNTTGLFDNTAGVAALLEAAKVVTPALQELDGTSAEVWFIAWDKEEQFDGSWTWVAEQTQATLKRLLGVWNMDSVGSFSQEPNGQKTPYGFEKLFPGVYKQIQDEQSRPNFLAVIADSNSAGMASALNETTSRCQIPLRVIPIGLPVPGAKACHGDLFQMFSDFCRSDHAAFWEVGVPGLHITDTANYRNGCYHRNCDNWFEMKEENWSFLLQITAVLADTVYYAVSNGHNQL